VRTAIRAFHRRGLIVVAAACLGPLVIRSEPAAVLAQGSAPLRNFTGVVTSLDASDIRGVRFRYEAGARSYWHAHDGPLVLLIEQGRGRLQIKGQAIRDFGPGEPVLLPANVQHWHGAAPDQGLTWLALTVGSNVTTSDPVTDDEYRGKPTR
jgi:quercetin dioxygenase-like cupin family protein